MLYVLCDQAKICQVLRSPPSAVPPGQSLQEVMFPTERADELDRYFYVENGVLKKRSRVILKVAPAHIAANGTDESLISFHVINLEEKTSPASLTLSIRYIHGTAADVWQVETPLTDAQGTYRFSTEVPGEYEISVPDPRMLCLPHFIWAKEA